MGLGCPPRMATVRRGALRPDWSSGPVAALCRLDARRSACIWPSHPLHAARRSGAHICGDWYCGRPATRWIAAPLPPMQRECLDCAARRQLCACRHAVPGTCTDMYKPDSGIPNSLAALCLLAAPAMRGVDCEGRPKGASLANCSSLTYATAPVALRPWRHLRRVCEYAPEPRSTPAASFRTPVGRTPPSKAPVGTMTPVTAWS